MKWLALMVFKMDDYKKLPHGNVEAQKGWCWIVNYKTRKKQKILKINLQYWLDLGWEKGGAATKFPIGKRRIDSY